MKSSVANYKYRVLCLRVEATDGTTIVRLTHHPVDLTMSNDEIYYSSSGYDFTGFSSNASMSPSTIDLQGIFGAVGFSEAEIMSGLFDNARCYLFATDWSNPVEDEEEIVCSILGKTTIMDDKYVIEEMSLIDALNQTVGRTYTASCYKTFGGQEYAGCLINVGSLTETGTITSVTSSLEIADSSRIEVADYFRAGTIQFTTGDNAGLSPLEIKTYAANGTITLFESFYYTVQVGDEYEIVPGCRKRHSDCRNKWNNVANFGGFSYIPTKSQYLKYGTK